MRQREMGKLRYLDPKTKAPMALDMRKWLSDQAKVLDAAMVQQGVTQKVGDARG